MNSNNFTVNVVDHREGFNMPKYFCFLHSKNYLKPFETWLLLIFFPFSTMLQFQKGDISKHEALGNEWLTKGNCPIAKSYRAVGRVLPLVATALKPPTAMKFKCPAAVVAARAALARTTFVKNLRPQPLPAKVLAIAALGMALNVPLGMWKEHTKKFSLSWFAAVHAAVPFIAMLRKSVLMPKSAMVLTIAASILGQVIGSRAERIRMKAIAEMGKVTTLTETMSSVQTYNPRQFDDIRTSRCGAEGMVLNSIPVKDAGTSSTANTCY
jgi:hypothetical protein